MKKFFLSTMMLGAVATANAQEVKGISYGKFWDNWQIGVNAGGYTPTTRYGFFESFRPNFGLEIGKQISPAFRLSLDGTAYINNNVDGVRNPLVIEHTNVALLGTFNLSNIFGGYKGTPRTFEVEGFAGPGWMHNLYQGEANNTNQMTAKFGANFVFNLGESKAWAVKFTPSILYAVDAPATRQQNSLNIDNSITQASLGLVYKFKGSNGAHHFTKIEDRIIDQTDEINAKDRQLRDAQERINQLENQLQDARNRKPEVQTKTVTETKKTLESVVTFRQGKSTIDASQLPNVERIATYLNKHRDSKVVIKGFASPEGSVEVNERIANARAQAVKDILVKKYRIAESRISAQGNGIGDMFSEPDWNRVSIATIVEQ